MGQDELIYDEKKDGKIPKFIPEPNHTIVINNQNNTKSLTLDFNTGKLVVSGNLKQTEAAKIFFESLNGFFEQAINKQVEKRLKEK